MKFFSLIICLLLLMANCLGTPPVYGWDYQYSIDSPNTRSESVYGMLFHHKKEIPKEYEHIITPLGEFEFRNELVKWLPRGKLPGYVGNWICAQTKKNVELLLSGKDGCCRRTGIKENPPIVSTEPYIAGTYENPPKGAGADWFYVVKQGLWVNPAKMDEVLKTVLQQVKAP